MNSGETVPEDSKHHVRRVLDNSLKEEKNRHHGSQSEREPVTSRRNSAVSGSPFDRIQQTSPVI